MHEHEEAMGMIRYDRHTLYYFTLALDMDIFWRSCAGPSAGGFAWHIWGLIAWCVDDRHSKNTEKKRSHKIDERYSSFGSLKG